MCLSEVRPLCLVSLFWIRKNPKSNEGGQKKHIRKKTLNLFLEKNKKNVGQISVKGNEGEGKYF